MTPSINDGRIAWFYARYTVVATQEISAAGSLNIGTRGGACRYCGKSQPDVTFKKQAHAFPEATGNKWLFSLDECDTCNDTFGRVIEDDFGKFSSPWRVMGRIRGKNGVPSYKASDRNLRIDVENTGDVRMSAHVDDPRFTIDDVNRRFTIHFERQPYTPMGVFKCFVKMSLAIMPREYLSRCAHLTRWILEETHSYASFPYRPLVCFFQFIPGPLPNDRIWYILLRRKENVSNVPYMQFVLHIGNAIYQIVLPFPKEDKAFLTGDSINIGYFPNPWLGEHEGIYGPVACSQLDLSSPEIKRNEDAPITMRFDHALPAEQKS